MNFFKQITAEFKNMLHSKFIIISAGLIFTLICVALPIFINTVNNTSYYQSNYTITVDGVEVPCNNDFAWELDYLLQKKGWELQDIEDEKIEEYATALFEQLIEYYSKYTLATMGEYDYRVDKNNEMVERVYENFFLSQENPDKEKLLEAADLITYSSSYAYLLELSEEEKQENLPKIMST